MAEVIPLEEERLASIFCKSIGKAITEIELCRMSTTTAKIAVGLARKLRLLRGDSFNLHSCFAKQLVKTPASNWIAAAIDQRCSLHKISGRKTSDVGLGNCISKDCCIGFATQNRNQRGRVEDHRGRPFSSYSSSP